MVGGQSRRVPAIYWLHGSTGCGKSKAAFDFAGRRSDLVDEYAWVAPGGGGKWFDGYWGQELAIFDDLRAEDYKFNLLLRIFDRYPLQLEIKGGMCWWNPEFIIVTAPKSISAMFEHLGNLEDIAQLRRRVYTKGREYNMDDAEQVDLWQQNINQYI